MDSEFIGKQWFEWLEQQDTCYLSRIKSNAMRWHIKTLFGCLKSRGFDLEATHMTETVIGQLINYFEIERIRT